VAEAAVAEPAVAEPATAGVKTPSAEAGEAAATGGAADSEGSPRAVQDPAPAAPLEASTDGENRV